MEPMMMKLNGVPNARIKNVRYKHFGQEFVLVLKGCIELVVGNTTYTLNEGDNAYFNCGLPHAFWNKRDDETEVLSINAPPNF